MMTSRWGYSSVSRRKSTWAPAWSDRSAGTTRTRKRLPRVSTSSCRLRPRIFFPPIIAAWPADFGRLDGLAVQDRRRGLWCPSRLVPVLLPQGLLQPVPGAIAAPGIIVVAHALPGRIVRGDHPPLAARAQQGEDGVEDLPCVI